MKSGDTRPVREEVIRALTRKVKDFLVRRGMFVDVGDDFLNLRCLFIGNVNASCAR